ncbi:hypothetical protein GDO86_014745 [Hymenochirus boettgeri]|uniref:Uncharacterized protein n=1 Tax=Hymenochirus boettgeri TaxID=247094 RepID=A0A8T2JU07_9PIPI|nr:hypothetical protein GDO86_014745 [Hymenochirus boettgeri]
MSFQRIERGKPHYQPKVCYQGSTGRVKGALPLLSLTTLPDLPRSSFKLKTNDFQTISQVRLAGLSCPELYELYRKAATYRSEKKTLPSLQPNKEFKRSKGRNRPNVSPQTLYNSDVMESNSLSLIWVPNTQWDSKQKKEEKGEPFKLCIKELSLESLPSKNGKSQPGQHSKKKSSVPTGGCPSNLSVTLIQPPARGSIRSSWTKENKDDLLKRNERFSSCQSAKKALTSTAIVPELENQRVILHHVKERHQQGAALQRTSPVYKMDDKHPDDLNDTDIKLESIKNQSYLWNKCITSANHSSRVKPSDHQEPKSCRIQLLTLGVIGNMRLLPYDACYYKRHSAMSTEGSVFCTSDTENREGMSEGSNWAQSGRSSAGVESRMGSLREEPDEDITHVDSLKITGEQEDLKPTQMAQDVQTLSSNPTEICDLKGKDEETPLLQSLPTPQPHSPPPTPGSLLLMTHNAQRRT